VTKVAQPFSLSSDRNTFWVQKTNSEFT